MNYSYWTYLDILARLLAIAARTSCSWKRVYCKHIQNQLQTFGMKQSVRKQIKQRLIFGLRHMLVIGNKCIKFFYLNFIFRQEAVTSTFVQLVKSVKHVSEKERRTFWRCYEKLACKVKPSLASVTNWTAVRSGGRLVSIINLSDAVGDHETARNNRSLWMSNCCAVAACEVCCRRRRRRCSPLTRFHTLHTSTAAAVPAAAAAAAEGSCVSWIIDIIPHSTSPAEAPSAIELRFDARPLHFRVATVGWLLIPSCPVRPDGLNQV